MEATYCYLESGKDKFLNFIRTTLLTLKLVPH